MNSKTFLLIIFILLAPFIRAREYTVRELMELALENADSVRLKARAMVKAGHSMEEAKARLLPDVDLKASFTLMSDPPEGITIEKGSLGYAPSVQSALPVAFPAQDIVLMEDTQPTYFKITATLMQPLFTWNKIEKAIELSRLDYDISRISLDKVQAEVRRDTAHTYFAVVLARESVLILEESGAILTEILADRERAFSEGYINLLKVLEAKKNLARMEQANIQAGEAYTTSLAGLSFYTGTDLNAADLNTPFSDRLPELAEEQLKAAALKQSYDLEILRQQSRQASCYVKIEEAAAPFKPDVSLIASLDITGQKIPIAGANWMDTWDHNFTLTLGTQMKLFDGGKAANKIKAARDTAAMASLGISQMEKGLVLSVRKAIQGVRTGFYTVLEKKAGCAEAEEAAKNARVAFENELITREEERGAALLSANAKMELLAARYNYQTALIELEFLCGAVTENP